MQWKEGASVFTPPSQEVERCSIWVGSHHKDRLLLISPKFTFTTKTALFFEQMCHVMEVANGLRGSNNNNVIELPSKNKLFTRPVVSQAGMYILAVYDAKVSVIFEKAV